MTTTSHGKSPGSDQLWEAVKTVIVADFVMSLDNVIAIAGAAEGAGGEHKMVLVIFGLLVSIPIIVWGSQLVVKMMALPGSRHPGRHAARLDCRRDGGHRPGAQRLGSDPEPLLPLPVPAVGAAVLLVLGKWLAARARAARPAPLQAATGPQLNRLQHVLLAVDGSENSAQAVRYLIGVREDLRQPDALDVHLLNVQRPVSGEVSRFVPDETSRSTTSKAASGAGAGACAAGCRRGQVPGAPPGRQPGGDHCRGGQGDRLRPGGHGHARHGRRGGGADRFGGAGRPWRSAACQCCW